MSNWCKNIILISGPSEDVSVLYKSLKEYYDAEVKSKEKEPDEGRVSIGAWIKDKFSDKLPEFTEYEYEFSYRNFIVNFKYTVDDDQAYLVINSESEWVSRMYALVKLIEVGFPKCIMNYKSEEPVMEYYINTDESGKYFPERWYYCTRFKSYYYNSDEDMSRTLINDYADIIKDNNIVIPAIVKPSQDQICKLVDSLVEYDESLCVYPFSIGPEYDDKDVDKEIIYLDDGVLEER